MSDRKNINEIWAWVCIDENGDEGIPAFRGPQSKMMMPCIGGDKERIESLRPVILAYVAPFRPVKLCKFSKRTVVEVVRHDEQLDS